MSNLFCGKAAVGGNYNSTHDNERIPEKWHGRIKMEKLLSGNLFAKISSQQAQEIRDVLERNKERIPQVMEKEILFALKYITE